MPSSAERFVADLYQLGLNPRTEAELVIYSLEPVDGARAGVEVETAVAVEELARWSQIPPHWIHLPDDVTLVRTNRRPSTRSGWSMHSRNIGDWGRDDPAIAWIAHVRGVLTEVTS